MTEYRITYLDTQRAADDEDNQIRGISIFDYGTHGPVLPPVNGSVTMGASSYGVLVVANGGGASTYAELVAFFTGSNGRMIRITGSNSDGDFTITSDPVFTPPTSLPTFGFVNFNIDVANAAGTLGVSGVQFEDVTPDDMVELTGSGEPDLLTIINNDENKFATIRAKQLKIEFASTETIDVNTFKSGPDNRWYVEAWINTTDNIDFKGYLVTDDLQQPFLPNPKIVVLTASDHIGILKDVALVDQDGLNPQGKWRLAQFLSWALAQTGLNLPIYVVNNIRPGGKQFVTDAAFIASGNTIATPLTTFFYPGQSITISGTASNDGTFTVVAVGVLVVQLIVVAETIVNEAVVTGVTFDDNLEGHIYDKVYIDAKTFESNEIGISESCYSVIGKILLYSCYIEQAKGSWWITRIDELQAGTQEVAHFDSDGVFVDIQTKTLVKSIGITETLKWADASCLYRLRRPYSFIKLKYNYSTPAETVCNVDFSRGDFIDDLPDVAIEGVNYNAQSFNLDDWTLGRYARLDPTPGASTTTAYIERLYQYGYEKLRFASIGFSTAATPYEYIRSCPISINKGDKISFAIDFRFSADGGTDDIPVAGYLLYGDDGNIYEWVDAGTWNNMTVFIAGNPAFDTIAISSSQFSYGTGLKTEWNTFASDMLPAPSGGKFYIYLQANYTVTGGFIYYQNLNFTYNAFINGSYQKYAGQYHQVSQPGDYKAKIDDVVYISDSPAKLFKGAMFFLSGDEYFLLRNYYDAIKTPSPSGSDIKPYGEIQSQDVWVQFDREMGIFSGNVRGLDSDVQDADDLPDNPDLIHNYLLTDANVSTDNKVFMGLSVSQDRKTQISSMTVIEVYDSAIGKTPGDHVFKYLSQ